MKNVWIINEWDDHYGDHFKVFQCKDNAVKYFNDAVRHTIEMGNYTEEEAKDVYEECVLVKDGYADFHGYTIEVFDCEFEDAQ